MTGMMERNKALFTNKNDDYRTPDWLWSDLNEEFKFTLDPCASAVPLASWLTNYTIEDDGLRQSWQGYRVFINPPYSNVAEWVEKGYEWMYCKQKPAEIIVMLLAARTDTDWFHRYIYNTKNVEIRFIRGRLLFEGTANTAPFPSMVVVMKPMF